MSILHHSRSAAATAVALAAMGAAALPAQSAFAAPAEPLSVSVSGPIGHSPLQPGGKAESFIVTVKNSTAKPALFAGLFTAKGEGVLPLTRSDIALSVTPVHAPSTATTIVNGSDELAGWFVSPHNADDFTVPAHTSYTWKLSLTATKAWPLNDNGLMLDVFGQNATGRADINLKVGNVKTGGPLVAVLSGGDYLSPGHPMVETLTLTNRTGAALKDTIFRDLSLSPVGKDTKTIENTDIVLQTWQHGHWVAWTDTNLGELTHGLANGAHAGVTVRFLLAKQTMPTPSGHIAIHINGGVISGGTGIPLFNLQKVATVYR